MRTRIVVSLRPVVRDDGDELAHLSKMDLIEHHLIGMGDAPESGDEGENGDHRHGKLVIPIRFSRLRRDRLPPWRDLRNLGGRIGNRSRPPLLRALRPPMAKSVCI